VPKMDTIDIPIKYIDLLTKEVSYFRLFGGCVGYGVDGRVYTPHYSLAVFDDF